MSIAIALPLAACLLLMVEKWKVSAIEPWEIGVFGAIAVVLGPPVGFYCRTLFSDS